MHPTAAGRTYLFSAEAALREFDLAAEQLRAAPGLIVGAQASIADELLPQVLDELRLARPELNVLLRPESDRSRILAALDSNEIDVAVLLDAGDHVGDLGFGQPTAATDHLDVREVQMTVVVPPGHRLLGRPVTMQEIRRSGSLIGREARCSFWMAASRWLGPDIAITAVGGLAQVREWVATGRGIALLPEFAVHADIGAQRLAQLDVQPPPLHLRLIWRQDRANSDGLRQLLYALTRA
jgi:DNA-binding transcriptional LysR family regulator